MRKAVKIKAAAVFIAWLVIFTHSIIPHNHPQDNNNSCYQLFHEATPDENGCDIASKFESRPDEVNVCRFSNFLFNQLNQDNLMISNNRGPHYYPVFLALSASTYNEGNYISQPYYGTAPLRAPPSV